MSYTTGAVMSFKFSTTSKNNLIGVHPDLVKVVERALELSSVDFKVVEGVRSPARQRMLYAQGRTTPGKIVTWTLNSNHFKKADGYGHAVDLLPAPYDWEETKPFDLVAKAMFAAGKELGVEIRWGADWDEDGNPRERGESDSPHVELS
jgi:peptidoglycan L-alanyl-D-glutamate endopeptidase CwlK